MPTKNAHPADYCPLDACSPTICKVGMVRAGSRVSFFENSENLLRFFSQLLRQMADDSAIMEDFVRKYILEAVGSSQIQPAQWFLGRSCQSGLMRSNIFWPRALAKVLKVCFCFFFFNVQTFYFSWNIFEIFMFSCNFSCNFFHVIFFM